MVHSITKNIVCLRSKVANESLTTASRTFAMAAFFVLPFLNGTVTVQADESKETTVRGESRFSSVSFPSLRKTSTRSSVAIWALCVGLDRRIRSTFCFDSSKSKLSKSLNAAEHERMKVVGWACWPFCRHTELQTSTDCVLRVWHVFY